MNNSEIINDFVDGGLPPEKEDELFEMLRTNTAARDELKDLMAVKSAVRSDTEAFIPPAKSTMAIFGSLGFQAPVPAPRPISYFTRFKNFASNYRQAITGGLAASGLTAAVILMLLNPFAKQENSADQYAKNRISANSNIPVSSASPESKLAKSYNSINNSTNNDSKNIDSKSWNSKNTISANGSKVIVKYIYVPVKNVDKSGNGNLAENLPPAESTVQTSQQIQNKPEPIVTVQPPMAVEYAIPFLQQANMNLSNNGIRFGSVPFWPMTAALTNADSSPIGLIVELSGSQYWFADKDRMNPKQRQALNNVNIGLLCELTDELSAGLEYRRESFYQKFDGTELTDKGVRMMKYEQEPNFQTLSVNLRYTPEFAKYSVFCPYTQISTGMNKAGMVGRLFLGTEIHTYSNYYLTLGYDYSMMRYLHQSSWFNTEKKGLHIGAGVKL